MFSIDCRCDNNYNYAIHYSGCTYTLFLIVLLETVGVTTNPAYAIHSSGCTYTLFIIVLLETDGVTTSPTYAMYSYPLFIIFL